MSQSTHIFERKQCVFWEWKPEFSYYFPMVNLSKVVWLLLCSTGFSRLWWASDFKWKNVLFWFCDQFQQSTTTQALQNVIGGLIKPGLSQKGPLCSEQVQHNGKIQHMLKNMAGWVIFYFFFKEVLFATPSSVSSRSDDVWPSHCLKTLEFVPEENHSSTNRIEKNYLISRRLLFESRAL